MENPKITEKDLINKYGPIYNRLFEKSYPVKSLKELKARDNFAFNYLKKNPSKVFKTGNTFIINEVDNYVKNHTGEYVQKELADYKRKKKKWELEKLGYMSKPALAIIFSNLSFMDLVEYYEDPELKRIADKSGIWDKKLKELNKEYDTDFKKLLEIQDTARAVITILGIKEILSDAEPFKRVHYMGCTNEIDIVYSNRELSIIGIKASAAVLKHCLPVNRINYEKPLAVLLKVLPYLTNLRYLNLYYLEDLANNTLKRAGNLQALKIIFDDNIKNISKELFHGLYELTHLTIYGIEKLSKDAFIDLYNMQVLEIINVNFTTLPKDIFRNNSALINLFIHNTKLKHIPENLFKGLVNLTELVFSHNQIETLPRLPNIRRIDLQDNIIKILHGKAFRGLDKLETLYLNNNQIKIIIADKQFRGLDKLKFLLFDKNPMGDMEIPTFKSFLGGRQFYRSLKRRRRIK